MTEWQHRHDVVTRYRHELDLWIVDRAADAEVDLLRADEIERPIGYGVAQHDRNARVLLAERGNGERKARRAHRWERRDADFADDPGGDVARALHHVPELAQQLIDCGKQILARGSQRDRARVAIEQAHVQRVLELADLRAQRRLARVEDLRSLREALHSGDANER